MLRPNDFKAFNCNSSLVNLGGVVMLLELLSLATTGADGSLISFNFCVWDARIISNCSFSFCAASSCACACRRASCSKSFAFGPFSDCNFFVSFSCTR